MHYFQLDRNTSLWPLLLQMTILLNRQLEATVEKQNLKIISKTLAFDLRTTCGLPVNRNLLVGTHTYATVPAATWLVLCNVRYFSRHFSIFSCPGLSSFAN